MWTFCTTTDGSSSSISVLAKFQSPLTPSAASLSAGSLTYSFGIVSTAMLIEFSAR